MMHPKRTLTVALDPRVASVPGEQRRSAVTVDLRAEAVPAESRTSRVEASTTVFTIQAGA